MSEYKNFIHDYPQRCRRLLSRYFNDAEANDLEVTLLLNIASSSIIIPYERFSMDAHPSRDVKLHIEGKKSFDTELNKSFLNSKLWGNFDPRSWRYGELRNINTSYPDGWNLDKQKPLSKEKKALTIIKDLRNALAHGNIFMRGSPDIETLVFLSRKVAGDPDAGYNCILVSPVDMKDFVVRWLDFLDSINFSRWEFAA